MSFHSRKAGRPRASSRGARAAFGLTLVLALSGASAGRAGELASDWIYGKKSAARLIAAPAADSYRAGIEISLDDDSVTYWRNPGDAGAPPEFDFSQSDNVEEATVRFPTPERLHEDGLDVFGYRRAVTLPVSVRLKDPSRPALLALALSYAVCGKICIPVSAHLQMRLPPAPRPDIARADAAKDAAKHADALRAAEARVPRRLSAQERDEKLSLMRDQAAARPTWRVRLRGDADPSADLFVEAPQGWFFETRRGDDANEFIVTEVEAPAQGGHAPATLTLSSGTRGYEFAADLGRARAVADGAPAHMHGEMR